MDPKKQQIEYGRCVECGGPPGPAGYIHATECSYYGEAEEGIDPEDNPDYYKVGGIEAIDFIRAKLTPREFVGYCKGSILHYTARMAFKYGGTERVKDAKKIRWYAQELPEAEKRAEEAGE